MFENLIAQLGAILILGVFYYIIAFACVKVKEKWQSKKKGKK